MDSFLAIDYKSIVTLVYKDEALDRLAAYGNVAQFASFGPALAPRYSRILNHSPNENLSLDVAAKALMAASPERKINIRSFRPESHQGNEFLYGLDDIRAIVAKVRYLAMSGLFVILNETIDVNDGGVSGVLQGSVIEFASGGTPRVVDTARTVSLRQSTGIKVLESVYGFSPELSFPAEFRVEFSIHPVRRGWRQTHTIIWELEESGHKELSPNPCWPNDFSRFIGDKAFGLLVAFGEEYDVPRTMVLSRHLPPFSFGYPTHSDVRWIRTCPCIPAPGRFTTVRGWTDPFKVLATEDPCGTEISSVLVQDEVPAEFSGALLTDVNGNPIIEGVAGRGDALMIGSVAPTTLPQQLHHRLEDLHNRILTDFGSIRLEWAFDNDRLWILQLQQESSKSSGIIIVDGDFSDEVTFIAETGLEELRVLARRLSGKGVAIRLVGNVGMTSHMADVLRRSGVASRLVRR